MDLKHQIGQHLVTGFPGIEMSEDFIKAVKEYKIGNVILFARNIESKEQLTSLIKNINVLYDKEVGIRPFITIDQEGGMVTRLSEDCVNIPGAMALSATNNEEYLDECTRINCRQLKELGINCNLAPVLDVNCNKDNPVIGVRSYSDKPMEVARLGSRVINIYEEKNLLCVAKHFPGHGDTALDSHLALPTVKKSYAELEQMELLPFFEAIKKGVPAIMTSHILYPSLEEKKIPATMSKSIITDLLREKLGFEGLVFSDDMEMNAIKDYYGTVSGVIESLKAGADLMFVSHHPKIAMDVCSKIFEAYNRGEFDLTMWNNSSRRIRAFKKEYSSIRVVEPIAQIDRDFVYNVKKASLTRVNGKKIRLGNNPLFISPKLFKATNVSNDYISLSFSKEITKYINGQYITCSSNPTDEEIAKYVSCLKNENITDIVLATYNAHLYEGQIKLANALKNNKLPYVIVALRNPYDLKEVDSLCDISIAAYEYTKDSIRLISQFLKGEFDLTGKLPVHI